MRLGSRVGAMKTTKIIEDRSIYNEIMRQRAAALVQAERLALNAVLRELQPRTPRRDGNGSIVAFDEVGYERYPMRLLNRVAVRRVTSVQLTVVLLIPTLLIA